MANENKKSGIGVLDAVIIIVLAICVVAAGFAFVFKRSAAEDIVPEEEYEEYLISFESLGVRRSTAQMIKDGDSFMTGDNDDLGTLTGALTVTPSVVYITDENGICVKTYAPDNGDYTKMDISGTLTVKGIRNDRGVFLLNGTVPLAPNKQLFIHTDTVSLNANVTDIGKVSK